MLLTTKCKSCNDDINRSYLVADRFGLVKIEGEEFNVSCDSCGADNLYHVDDFRATKDPDLYKKLLLFALGAGFLLSLVFFLMSGMQSIISWMMMVIIFFAPIIILVLYLKLDTDNQRQFNRVKLSGRAIGTKFTSTADKKTVTTVGNVGSLSEKLQKHNTERLPSNKKATKE